MPEFRISFQVRGVGSRWRAGSHVCITDCRKGAEGHVANLLALSGREFKLTATGVRCTATKGSQRQRCRNFTSSKSGLCSRHRVEAGALKGRVVR